MRFKIEKGKIQRGLILRNEKANDEYSTQFLTHLYAEEGRGIFSVRQNILGHMQQGGSPSPFDRNFGTEMAAKATVWLVEKAESNLQDGQVIANDPDTAVLLGLCRKTLEVCGYLTFC